MDIHEKVLATFQVEHKEQLEAIRKLLAEAAGLDASAAAVHLEEAFRLAHNLKGGARVCDLPPIESLCHRLETLFAQVGAERQRLDGPVAEVVNQVLDRIEDWMTCLSKNESPEDPTPALDAIERLLEELAGSGQPGPAEVGPKAPSEAPTGGTAPAPPAPRTDDPLSESEDPGINPQSADALPSGELSEPPSQQRATAPPSAPFQSPDMVRVRTESLDQLLRSSGQLLTESLGLDRVTRELAELAGQIQAMERQQESVRKTAAASLHRLGGLPEFRRVVHCVELAESQGRSLSSQARRVRLLQQRVSWTLRSRCQQIQQHVQQARMAPAESVLQGFRKMVRDLARDEGKEVHFTVTGFDVPADRMVLQALKDPLMHMLRNAVIHGIESCQERLDRGKDRAGQVALNIQALDNRLHIQVQDDGRGLDRQRMAELASERGLLASSVSGPPGEDELASLVFQPGFSTSRVVNKLSGRGMGLSVVYETVARLQGQVHVQGQAAAAGLSLLVSVPLALSTHRLLLVSEGHHTFALPTYGIERLLRIKLAELETVEGRPMVYFQGQPVPVLSLAHLLGLGERQGPAGGEVLPVAILRLGATRVAVGVEAFDAEGEFLIQPLTGPAARLNQFAGGILRDDGSVVLVLNPNQLLSGAKPAGSTEWLKTAEQTPEARQATVLVVDDSFTTRTLEKSILEAHGYRVRVAVDGVEALSLLRAEQIDLVISDLQMPRMDGFGLLQQIKQDSRLARLPVVLVTSMDRREDQERGLALGADAYIMKRKFDHQDLLETIGQLL